MRLFIFLAPYLLLGCASLNPSDTPQLRATINRSEWASANWLKLDLQSGRYSITPGYHTSGNVRGRRRIVQRAGILEANDLDQVNRAVTIALTIGLQDADCLSMPRNERGRFVVSNGGPLEIRIRGYGLDETARDELECWTDEGNALYHLLEELFAS